MYPPAPAPTTRLPLILVSGKVPVTLMPKSCRCGQAEILDVDQLDALMQELKPECRAILSTCRFTAARINEALSLKWENVLPSAVVIPKACTKKKMATRTVPLHPKLHEELEHWRTTFDTEPAKTDWLFPSRRDPSKHFPRRTVDYALRTACKKLGFDGVATHSFRRSALTAASAKGVPLRVIQSISGHSSLDILQRYLSVTDSQKREAALAFD